MTKKVDKKTFFIILGLMTVSFCFGIYKIQDAALTDEHYWIFDRAPKFWENVLEHDANGTRRSDKPGETLMVLLGPSVMKTGFLKDREAVAGEQIAGVNFAYRLPVLLFMIISLPVFFFLISKVFGSTIGFLSASFIGLSPILVGMSRAVNPDSLLWIFSSWSILAYFVFLKEKTMKWVVWSGIFMGLALLTKYVANILFVYFLGVIFLEYIFQGKDAFQKKATEILRNTTISFLIFCLTSLLTFAMLYPAVWAKWSRLLLGTFTSEAFEPVWPLFVGVLIFIVADVFFFKSFLLSWALKFFRKNNQWIGRAIFGFFLLAVLVILTNTYLGKIWFNFEDILSSPKSSYQTESQISIFFANFYPLFFGISSLVAMCAVWFLSKGFLGKLDFTQERPKLALYLLIFILLYYLSSAFSQVASIIRYQIILYPIFLTFGAIGAEDIFNSFKILKVRKNKIILLVCGLVILMFSLFVSAPHYMAYASFLLPSKYYLDQKDMGYGSYEAAQYLNSLPNHKELSIWSDKKGVCDFFEGKCISNLKFKDLRKEKFDYYIVSSGRYSRVKSLVMVRVRDRSANTIRFDKLYGIGDPQWEMVIGGRKSNFVKIIKADSIDIYTID